MKPVTIGDIKLLAIIVGNGHIPPSLTVATTLIQLHNIGIIDKSKLRSWKV